MLDGGGVREEGEDLEEQRNVFAIIEYLSLTLSSLPLILSLSTAITGM
jgi:hypothetical protein